MGKRTSNPGRSRDWRPESVLEDLEHSIAQRRRLLKSPKRQRLLRIAARRLESVLLAFRDRMPPAKARTLAASLVALRTAAGAARDAGIGPELAAPRLERYPDAARAVEKAAASRAGRAAQTLAALVTKPRRRELLDLVELLVDAAIVAPGTPAARLAPRRAIARSLTRLREALGADLTHGEDLHRVRRRFKEVRYTIEVLFPLLPASAGATRLLRRLAVVQRSLGELGDLRIVHELLRAARRAARHDAAHELRSVIRRTEADIERLTRALARDLRTPRIDALMTDLSKLSA